jgi:hypothetical protein
MMISSGIMAQRQGKIKDNPPSLPPPLQFAPPLKLRRHEDGGQRKLRWTKKVKRQKLKELKRLKELITEAKPTDLKTTLPAQQFQAALKT